MARNRSLLALALATVVVGALPARAAAETAVMLPPGGERSLPVYFRSMATESVAAALGTEGVDVLDRTEVMPRLREARVHRCDRTECANDVARAAGADFAVGVAVWASERDGETPGTVAVSLIGTDGLPYSGTAQVDSGAVEAAATAALAEARARQSLGPGPWLHVDGTPVGAMVVVDDTPVGVVPYRGAIAPGRHTLTVRLTGYVSDERVLDVGIERTREHEVTVALAERSEPVAEAGAAAPPPDDGADHGGRSLLDTVGPIVLGVGGLAALGVAGYGLLAPEECTARFPDGSCRVQEGVTNEAAVGVWGGVGAAAVIGAIVWWILARPSGPDDGEARTPPPVRVGVGLTEVQLEIDF